MWLLIGLALYFWPWVLGAVAAILLALWVRSLAGLALAARTERRDARRAVAARADQQHAWVLAGDDRGLYGEYPPAA